MEGKRKLTNTAHAYQSEIRLGLLIKSIFRSDSQSVFGSPEALPSRVCSDSVILRYERERMRDTTDAERKTVCYSFCGGVPQNELPDETQSC